MRCEFKEGFKLSSLVIFGAKLDFFYKVIPVLITFIIQIDPSDSNIFILV